MNCLALGYKYLKVMNNSLIGLLSQKNGRGQQSTVVPTEKKKNSKTAEEFCPINVLSCCEKMRLEEIVKNQLVNFINLNEVLSPFLAGFREKVIHTKYYNEYNERSLVRAVFMNFRRAFETVSRGPKMLCKLVNIGLEGTVIKSRICFL